MRLCLVFALLVALSACTRENISTPSLSARLQPKTGLLVHLGDVPVVRQSNLRFTTTNGQRAFYDFSWVYQPILPGSTDANTSLVLGGTKSFVNGVFNCRQVENNFYLKISGLWGRADSAQLDVQVAKIWLPAFANGKIQILGKNPAAISLDETGFPDTDASYTALDSLVLEGALGSLLLVFPNQDGIVRFSSPRPVGEAAKWESAPPYLLVHLAPQRIAPGQRFSLGVSGSYAPVGAPQNTDTQVWKPSIEKNPAVVRVESTRLPLVPKPRFAALDEKTEIPLVPDAKKPLSPFDSLLADAVARLWEYPRIGYSNLAYSVDEQLPKEGFSIQITDNQINIQWSDDAGMRHAANALAFLTRPLNEKLLLPTGTIRDYPSTGWRGIHHFTGPNALAFHRRMYERILLPLRMNKVVLQCEQTDWKSQPGIRNPITANAADLAKEARFLKQNQVELIPLIQSFGHMEWFFVNNQNLDLATNPEIPYTLDVQKAKAQKAIEAIWDEAVALTGAKTLHFGLDEVDMIGWPSRDPELISTLWEKQLPFLAGIAQKHGATPMLWGDMLLGPGESIDFSNAETREHARRRRAVVPKGAYIADWHYSAEPEPLRYAPSLDVFQREGFRPVASTWFFPNNVRGFTLAAAQRGMGILQTTWADYESCEANMLKYIPQFGAYISSLDYAWSARPEMPQDLPYDPIALWTSLYYRHPKPVKDQRGLLFGNKDEQLTETGPYRFREIEARPLPSPCAALTLQTAAQKAKGVALLLSTSCFAEENELLATLRIEFEDGASEVREIRYGLQVRSPFDKRPVYAGARTGDLSKSGCYMPFQTRKKLRRMVLTAANSYGKVSFHGVSVVLD
ncbi:MAG: hypothetical protein ACOYOD_15295 [Saprospiraceae bacterium]